MALTSFAAWFSSPRQEPENEISATSSADGHATQQHTDEVDENADVTPALRFSFTPTQVKSRLRPWQRRPATPFARRNNESKKIWKRPVLQSIVANLNSRADASEKESDGIMRPIKKLRGANLNDQNKENVSTAIARWEREASPAKTPRRRIPKKYPALAALEVYVDDDEDEVTEYISSPLWADAEDEDIETVSLEDNTGNESPIASFQVQHAITFEEAMNADGTVIPYASHQTLSIGNTTSVCVTPDNADQALDGDHLEAADVLGAEDVEAKLNCPNQSLTSEISNCEKKFEAQNNTQGYSAVQTLHHASEDHDETSYLQAFLSRSRAQREARAVINEEVAPALKSQPTALIPAGLQLPSNDIESTSDEPVDYVASKNGADPEVGATEDHGDEASQAASPCRRSSRITKLPRPQRSISLPNTISLRRLNGTEFIAMQKESQSLAIATRTNTKRNKGTAINVHLRLQQIRAENHAPTNEHRPRTGRGIAWAEVIARMQGEEGAEVAYVAEVRQDATPDALATKEQTDEVSGTVESSGDIEVPSSQKEQKAVRRRRKENLGNANGTPAPKKTIELLLANAARTESKQNDTEVPIPTPMKRRKSKPVAPA